MFSSKINRYYLTNGEVSIHAPTEDVYFMVQALNELFKRVKELELKLDFLLYVC